MTIVITGWRTTIATELKKILPTAERVVRGHPLENDFPLDADRYLFAQGLMRSKPLMHQTDSEIREGEQVNYYSIVRLCDEILKWGKPVRICVIGSESGYRGSFDEGYAAMKARLHHYVENKALLEGQQLVAISPGIIGDAGMTVRRLDVERLDRRRLAHPLKRFLTSEEVAMMVKTLLYHQPYISGTVVRMHGGEPA